jgi:hypothetical protein
MGTPREFHFLPRAALIMFHKSTRWTLKIGAELSDPPFEKLAVCHT